MYLPWKVYNDDKQLMGRTRCAEDAAAFAEHLGEGAYVVYNRKRVWTNTGAADSWDEAARVMHALAYGGSHD